MKKTYERVVNEFLYSSPLPAAEYVSISTSPKQAWEYGFAAAKAELKALVDAREEKLPTADEVRGILKPERI